MEEGSDVAVEITYWIELLQDRFQWHSYVVYVMTPRILNCRKLLERSSKYLLLREGSLQACLLDSLITYKTMIYLSVYMGHRPVEKMKTLSCSMVILHVSLIRLRGPKNKVMQRKE
jgi:hypothetical protein